MRLPFPPSQNMAWRSVLVKGQVRVLLSAKGRAYRAAVYDLAEVRAHARASAGDRLSITIDLYPPDRRARDLDNHVKQVLDALMHAGLFPDDSQIDHLLVTRGPVVSGGEALVQVQVIGEGGRTA